MQSHPVTFDLARALRFKAVRKHLKMSQAELAKVLKVSQTLISFIEKGQADITSEIYEILFNKFNISIAYLNANNGSIERKNEPGQKQLLNVIKTLHADVELLKSEMEMLKMERNNRLKLVK
ncbi:MAG: Helix-turn-helix domain [Sphingobacteriaceae bacterium]|jgi:transcriptional regulator with XRE-family HTH domain|nr:Helix-turn-helix domain [Sphingobacteriaceae bacterium]